MVAWGFPVGPITLLDEVGLDVAEKAVGVLHAAFGERFAPAPAVARLVKESRLGRKAGREVLLVPAGGKKREADATVPRSLLGVHPNGGAHAATILQRLVLVLLNEAARAFGEGIVRSPRDGDIAALYGFGFPPFRGGPLRHADDLDARPVSSASSSGWPSAMARGSSPARSWSSRRVCRATFGTPKPRFNDAGPDTAVARERPAVVRSRAHDGRRPCVSPRGSSRETTCRAPCGRRTGAHRRWRRRHVGRVGRGR